MPPTAVVPTEFLAPAPAPVASISGNTLRMNVSDVMRAGRDRGSPSIKPGATRDG